jgi:hypothetical protein
MTREELEKYKTKLYFYEEYKKVSRWCLFLLFALTITTIVVFFIDWKAAIGFLGLTIINLAYTNYVGKYLLEYGEWLFCFEHNELGMTDNQLP